MGYCIRHAGKSDRMTPEEESVFEALHGFTFLMEDTKPTDFTPTDTLYEMYKRYAQRSNFATGRFAPTLNVKEFGVALRRVFDLDASRKTRRTCRGRNVWGYVHVRGPGSIVSHDSRGRPRRAQSAAAPAA